MKHISKEEFFKQLNSCEYGCKYLELVNNPENHLGKKDKGEVHHIHPRSLGGELKTKNNLVKLLYFNHTLAHIFLAKAAIELNANWKYEALFTLTEFSRKQINELSDVEKITIEDIYHWSELRKLAYIEKGKHHSKVLNNKSPEEKAKTSRKISEGGKKAHSIKTPEEEAERAKKANETIAKKSLEEKMETKRKQSEAAKKIQASKTLEEKAETIRKFKETNSNKSQEQKEIEHNNRSKAAKKREANKTQEEKSKRAKKAAETTSKKSIGEKMEIKRKQSEGIKKARFAETDEQKKEHYRKVSESNKITKAKNHKNKVKVIKNLGHPRYSIKWILPEELDYYISLGYYQKVA